MNSWRSMLLIFTLLVCLEAVASMVTAMRFCSPGQVVSGHCLRCYCNSRRELTNCVSTCSRASKRPSPGMKLECVPGRIVRKPCNICVCDSRGKITNCRNTCPPDTTHAPVVVVRQLDDNGKKEASTLAPCFVPVVEVSCENWYPGLKDDEGNTVPPPPNCSSSTDVVSSNNLDGYSSTSDISSTSGLSPASTENQQALSVESSTESVASLSTDESIAPNSASINSAQDALKKSEELSISVGSSAIDNDPHSNVRVDFTKSTPSLTGSLQSNPVPVKKTTEVTNAEESIAPNSVSTSSAQDALKKSKEPSISVGSSAIDNGPHSNVGVDFTKSTPSVTGSLQSNPVPVKKTTEVTNAEESIAPNSASINSAQDALKKSKEPSISVGSSAIDNGPHSNVGVDFNKSTPSVTGFLQPSAVPDKKTTEVTNAGIITKDVPLPNDKVDIEATIGLKVSSNMSDSEFTSLSGVETSSEKGVNEQLSPSSGAENSSDKSVTEEISKLSGVEISSDKSVSEQTSVVNGVDSSSDESVSEQPSIPNGEESSSDKGVSEQPLVQNGEEISSVKSVSEQVSAASGLDSSSDEIISKQPSVTSEVGSSSDDSVSEQLLGLSEEEISKDEGGREQSSVPSEEGDSSDKSISEQFSEPNGVESSSVQSISEQPSVPSEEGSSSDESVSENPLVSNDVKIPSEKSDSEQLSARNGADDSSVGSVSVPPSEPSGDERSSVMITSENAPAQIDGEDNGLSMFRRSGFESNGDEETSDAIRAVLRRQEEIGDKHFSLNSSSSGQIELVTEKNIGTKEEVMQGTSNYIDLEDETSTDVDSKILPFDRNVESNILAYEDMNNTNTARMEKILKTPKAGIIGVLFISYMATNIIGWDTFLGAITVDSNSTEAS